MRNFDFKRYTPRPKKLLRASLNHVKPFNNKHKTDSSSTDNENMIFVVSALFAATVRFKCTTCKTNVAEIYTASLIIIVKIVFSQYVMKCNASVVKRSIIEQEAEEM